MDAEKQAELEDRIQAKADAIAVLQNELAVLRQERAELLCPFKVGDRVVSVHNPRASGTVSRIGPRGMKIKVDAGTVGRWPFTSDWVDCDNWRLLEAGQ